MKSETHRGSTRISMEKKMHGTFETNKSFNHFNLEWGIKIKHTICRRPKNLTRMKAKLH